MAFNISELFSDPSRMAMLTGGLGMMAAARGGNTDLSKGGLGYGLMQGLQGGAQGYQMAKGFQAQDAAQQEAEQKKRAMDDMLMKLNMSPSAMNSQGVMRPGIQQGAQAFQNIQPERRQMAAMALQMGDVGAAMKAMSLDGAANGRSTINPYSPQLITDAAGNISMGNPYFDETTKESKWAPTTLPPGMRPVKETPWQARSADQAAAIQTEFGKTQASGNVQNWQKIASEGLAVADNYAMIARAKDLLSTVETSGFDAMQLKAKQYFGLEGADEGELSNLLGKSMVSQLRSTFGPQFTEKDREEFARIEAGFSKSPASNYRQLESALKIIDRKARRGMDAARRSGDDFTASEIENALSFKLNEPKATKAPAGVPTDVWNVMTPEERAAWQ